MSNKAWHQIGELIGEYLACLVFMALVNFLAPAVSSFTALAFWQLAIAAAALVLLVRLFK